MHKSPFGHLSHAYDRNHFDIDRPFQSILKYHLGFVPDLSSLGKFAGRELYEIADHVDKFGRPKHVMWSIDGDRVDKVWLEPSELWALEKLVRDYGINRSPYHNGDWMKHFAALYLVSDPGIGCIITVTNQTAYAIHKYGNGEAKKFLPHLIGDKEDIMYGATWFTEIQGGSDLGANKVKATLSDGGWKIDGDTKYFSSNAGLADVALVTARIENGREGAKGLGLFLVPEYNVRGAKNFAVRRLKEKSGTVSVPTGEVEFSNSEAIPIGEVGEGIYYTMENLMVSRLANSVAALGIARKALLETYYYSKKRIAFGKHLIDHPLYARDLLDMEVYLEGAMALGFKAVDMFQRSWKDRPPYSMDYHYARLLTHIAKNITAEMAANVTKMAMELHGGLGFLSDFPIERLHREALITPIWEGPSNIQALDMLEAISKKKAHLKLLEDVSGMKMDIRFGMPVLETSENRIHETLESLSGKSDAEAQFFAKDLLNGLGHSIAVIQLIHAANRLNSERLLSVAELYSKRFVERQTYGPKAAAEARRLIRIDEGE